MMASLSLTVWISPFTALGSLDGAISHVRSLAQSCSSPYQAYAPSLLLPTHFGAWPQSQCDQTLPADMLVATPDDVARIRGLVEAAGLGFGGWGVPVDVIDPRAPGIDIPALAASFAAAAGFYASNVENPPFWNPGDWPDALNTWWGGKPNLSRGFWPALADLQADQALNGNVIATAVPTTGEQLGWSDASLQALAGGCSGIALEVYGGRATKSSYPYPSLWPGPSFKAGAARFGEGVTLIPIIMTANLVSEIGQATALGAGNVHVWSL